MTPVFDYACVNLPSKNLPVLPPAYISVSIYIWNIPFSSLITIRLGVSQADSLPVKVTCWIFYTFLWPLVGPSTNWHLDFSHISESNSTGMCMTGNLELSSLLGIKAHEIWTVIVLHVPSNPKNSFLDSSMKTAAPLFLASTLQWCATSALPLPR